MAMGTYRAAIVGLGGMGRVHYQTYALHPRTTVVAGADAKPERIQQFIADFSLERTYVDWKDLLDRERVDILSVVTNGPSHAEIVMAAAEAGVKRIYSEKPMATSVADCQAMIDTCAHNGTILAINHTRRWWPEYQQLAHLIADGTIGPVSLFSFTLGAGRLGTNGSHVVDLMRMLGAGDPRWVLGFVDRTGLPNPHGPQFVDPGGYGIIQFDRGARGFIYQAENLGVDTHLEIVGSIGRVLINDMRGEWQIRARTAADRDRPLQEYDRPLVDVPFQPLALDPPARMQAAVDDLIEGRTPRCTGADGKTAIETIIGFHVSDQRGNVKVDLPLSGIDASMRYRFT